MKVLLIKDSWTALDVEQNPEPCAQVRPFIIVKLYHNYFLKVARRCKNCDPN